MPVIRLNDRSIDGLTVEKQTDFTDAGQPEFGLRVNPGGTKTWFVRVTLRGMRLRLKVGRWPAYNREQAWARAAGWIRMADAGEDPRAEAAPALTVEKLAELYIARQREKGVTYWPAEKRSLDYDVLPVLGTKAARDATRRDVRALLAAIRARPAPVQAEMVRALLGRLFRFAVREEIVAVNPAEGIARVTPARARDRVLSDDEIRTLWALWEQDGGLTALASQLVLLAGTRHRETLHIRRSLIRDGWIEIEARWTKGKRPHLVPVTAAVKRVVERVLATAPESDWLFPGPLPHKPLWSAQDGHERHVERSGIAFTIHDLRRTAYSAMRRLGIRNEVIEAFFNHAPGGLRRHYDMWGYSPERQEAAEVWHADLERILRKGEAGKVVAIHRQS